METEKRPVTTETTTTPKDSTLMETVKDIMKGNPPSTEQLTESIGSLQSKMEEHKQTIPADSKAHVIMDDVKAVLSDTERILVEKNRDDKFQRFLNDAKEATKETAKKTQAGAEVGKREIEPLATDLQRFLKSLQLLTFDVVRSSEFRGILFEAVRIMSLLVAHTTEVAAVDTQREVEAVQVTPVTETRDLRASTAETTIAESPRGAASTFTPVSTAPVTGAVKQVAQEVKEGRIAKEERQRLKKRLASLLLSLVDNPEFRELSRDLLALWDHFVRIISEARKESSTLPSTHIERMVDDAKRIIEEFTKRPLDNLISCINFLNEEIQKDEEARSIFIDHKRYFERTLERPELLKDTYHLDTGIQLEERLSNLIRSDKYSSELREILREVSLHLDGIANDKATQKLFEDMKSLASHLFLDDSGKITLDTLTDTAGGIRDAFVPVIMKELEYINIPKIEGSTEKYNFSLDNIYLYTKDIVPDKFHVSFDTDADVSLAKRVSAKGVRAKLTITVKDIDAHFKDIWFYLRRFKTPHWEDHGVVDVSVTGMNLHFRWNVKHKGRKGKYHWKFYMDHVKVEVNKLRLVIKEARHSIIDKLAVKLFAGTIKKKIENKIQAQLYESGTKFSRRVNYWVNVQLRTAGPTLKKTIEDKKNQIKGAFERKDSGPYTFSEEKESEDEKSLEDEREAKRKSREELAAEEKRRELAEKGKRKEIEEEQRLKEVGVVSAVPATLAGPHAQPTVLQPPVKSVTESPVEERVVTFEDEQKRKPSDKHIEDEAMIRPTSTPESSV